MHSAGRLNYELKTRKNCTIASPEPARGFQTMTNNFVVNVHSLPGITDHTCECLVNKMHPFYLWNST